jgi:hypothetical protein
MGARLPDLVVVGAPRSGTTTLTHWLRQHPGVAFSSRKEVEFFDLYYDQGLEWYASQLPGAPGSRVVVEATPSYLSDRHAPDRIAVALPSSRFVVVLREPVARAWSQYWFFVQLGLEKRPWEQAVREERPGEGPGYLWRGRYGEQLARWDSLMGRDRTLVLLLDDLVADPDAALRAVCSFAGLPSVPAPSREAVNAARLPRSARLQRLLQRTDPGPLRRRVFHWNGQGRPVPVLPVEERLRWAPEFTDDLAELERRMGRPLPSGWRTPASLPPLRRSAAKVYENTSSRTASGSWP